MCEGNYIKLNRKMLEWEWYKNTNTKALFLHLLLKANWKDGRFMGVEVPRGSLATSLSNLAKETGLTVKAVRVALEHLIETQEIVKGEKRANKRANQFTLLTVTRYDFYQTTTENGANEKANEGQTKGNNRRIIKNNKNINNNINNNIVIPPLPPKDNLDLPIEFQTTEFGDVWGKWVAYRKHIRCSLAKETAEGQIKKLQKMSGGDVSVAVAIIQQSIDNGWRGLFELKDSRAQKKGKTLTAEDIRREMEEAFKC